MKLEDLIKPVEGMSTAELMEHLQNIRHNKTILRPARKKHVEKPAKQEAKQAASKVNKMLDSLPPEQLKLLMDKLQAGG